MAEANVLVDAFVARGCSDVVADIVSWDNRHRRSAAFFRVDSIRVRIEKLRQDALARMRELRAYLAGDPLTVRAWLTKHVERIVMEPNGRIYVASGNWNLLGARHSECAEGRKPTERLLVHFDWRAAA